MLQSMITIIKGCFFAYYKVFLFMASFLKGYPTIDITFSYWSSRLIGSPDSAERCGCSPGFDEDFQQKGVE